MKRLAAILLWFGVGVALTGVFWPEFWRGEGLIGGDIYTYYFPQKIFYQERLAAGEFPLWNPLVGHGYPLIAESQTGAFYPPNLLAYQLWDVNTAYNIVQLLHYALGFSFSVLLGRGLGLSRWASALLGVVFIYGWFPAHITHEWAILGGAWIPAAIWCAERLLTSGHWRFGGGLALVLAMQMLPGHFHLAFITQVAVVGYAAGRVIFAKESRAELGKRFGVLSLAILLGFGIAAVQLMPTWELKSLSQRSAVGTYYDPGYGHIPLTYWTQMVAPFLWYGTGTDLNATLPAGSASTNTVEAHLYFGMLPVLLLLYGLFSGAFWRDRRWLLWGVGGVLALIYATGWLLTVTKPIPGFHFFRGVGRWGVLTTLAVAILSGVALDALLSHRRNRWLAITLAGLVLILTVVDLRIVRGLVGDGEFVPDPIIHLREESPIRQKLQAETKPVRLFCRGANLPTLLGVSSTPTYLGIGPDQYFDPEIAMPEPIPFDDDPTPKQITWLQNAGVTHILSFNRLNTSIWPVTLDWEGHDPFLQRAWGRRPTELFYLYRLKKSRGRTAWQSPENHPTPPEVLTSTANRVVLRTQSDEEGAVILTGLMYPGWKVQVDDTPQEALTIEGVYRGVKVSAGEHTIEWNYQPQSQRWGFIVSGLSLLLLLGITTIRCYRLKRN